MCACLCSLFALVAVAAPAASLCMCLGYTAPLVGPAHQVYVPPFTGPPPAVSSGSSPTQLSPSGVLVSAMSDATSGTPLWLPSLLVIKGTKGDPDKKRDALDRYLSAVDSLFYKDTDRHADEAKSLFFLHQCDYSISKALQLLKPWAPPVEDDSGVAEEEMYPADDFCGVCRDGGNLVLCDLCGNKAYHPPCVQLESVPSGAWSCPYHHCATCQVEVQHVAPPPPNSNGNAGTGGQRSSNGSATGSVAPHRPASFSCSMCPTSYCSLHIPADLKIRASAIGAFEPMCGGCLSKEEEYFAVQSDKGHSEIGYSTRRSFMHRLQMVLKRESRQLVRMPILAQREMDLYGLYIAVCRRGGLAGVIGATNANPTAAAAAAASSSSSSAAASAAASAASSSAGTGWRDIRRVLRLPSSTHPHLSSLLRRFYLHILYPYEKQFYPYFTPLTLKRALKEDQKECEEEGDDEDEAAMFAAPVVGSEKASAKRKKASAAKEAAAAAASAAAAGGESYPSLPPSALQPDPSLKDDLRPDDILLSLRVSGAGGPGVAMAAGAAANTKASKEQRARSKKAKEKAKEEARKRTEKEKKRVAKRAKELKGAAGGARNSRSRRDAAATRGSAAGGAKKGAKSAPTARSGENACINIYTPTPWALAANAAATHARNLAQAAAEAEAEAEAEAAEAAKREANGGAANDLAATASSAAATSGGADGDGEEDDVSAEEGDADDGEDADAEGDEELAAADSPALLGASAVGSAAASAAQQQSLLLSAYSAASAAAAAVAPFSLASAETLDEDDDEDLADADADGDGDAEAEEGEEPTGKDHKKQRIEGPDPPLTQSEGTSSVCPARFHF